MCVWKSLPVFFHWTCCILLRWKLYYERKKILEKREKLCQKELTRICQCSKIQLMSGKTIAYPGRSIYQDYLHDKQTNYEKKENKKNKNTKLMKRILRLEILRFLLLWIFWCLSVLQVFCLDFYAIQTTNTGTVLNQAVTDCLHIPLETAIKIL